MSKVFAAAACAAFAALAFTPPGDDELRETSDSITRRSEAFNLPRLTSQPGGAAVARLKAIAAARNIPTAAAGARWRSMGPSPTLVLSDDTSGGPPIASGRVTSIAVHPAHSNIAWLGAANGGVWKTIDAGRNWVPQTDGEDSLAIGSLALDPSNPDTIYAGTGEEDFAPDSYFGAGILKSRDGGKTWIRIARNFTGFQIGSMAVRPGNGRVLLAAVKAPAPKGVEEVNSGIYRSEDAGLTWKAVLKGAPGTAVVFDPANARIAYAGLGGKKVYAAAGIYKSMDGGITWEPAMRGIPAPMRLSVGRVSLAIAASHSAVLYASISNASDPGAETLGIFRTSDGGRNWAVDNTQSYCQPVCWYANPIQVSPEDENVAVVGGTVFYITHDGGANWVPMSQGGNGNLLHWDIHALQFGSDGRLYIGGDGGVFRGDNTIETPIRDIGWVNLNATLALTQFYPGCATSPNTQDFMLCGAQDNGTQLYTGGGSWWRMIGGGDGGFNAVDEARPSVYYFSASGYIDIYKSSPFTWYKGDLEITSGIEGENTNACFTPPLAIDPANPLRLYFACQTIYRSDDGGGLWKAISPKIASGFSDGSRNPTLSSAVTAEGFTYLAVAPGRSDRVYAASSRGQILRSDNATAASGVVWKNISRGIPGRNISSIAADPFDADTVWVTMSGFSLRLGGHVFRTADAGASWKDAGGNLPDVSITSIALDSRAKGTAYVGTDSGVFETLDSGKSWSPLGTGLPGSPVMSLKFYPEGALLRVATYGRGVWELALPGRLLAPQPFRILSALAPQGNGMPHTPMSIEVKGLGFSAKTAVRWNGEERATRSIDGRTLSVDLSPEEAEAPGRALLSLIDRVRGTISNTFNLDTGPPPSISGVAEGANEPSAQKVKLTRASMATVYGAAFASQTVTSAGAAQTLADTIVEFKSYVKHLAYPATLSSVSPGKITFQVPEDAPLGTLYLDVVHGTRMSNQLELTIR